MDSYDFSPRMPFGKYEGRKLAHIRRDYIEWLLEQSWLFDDLRREIEYECRRRDRLASERAKELLPERDLTGGAPGVIECVELSGAEAALFDDAAARGELLLTPDVPLGSRAKDAWRLWCEAWGLPHRVREVAWGEVEKAMTNDQEGSS